MASSEVQVCNSALIKVGVDLIISLADENKRAGICQHQYPILRDEVLRAHPWKFALARVNLAEVPASADDEDEFSNWFQLPSDVLRVLDIVGMPGIKWKREGDKVLINSTTCRILYIKQVTDTTKWDASFSECLATRLASDLAWSLNQNAAMSETLMNRYMTMIRPARSFSAQEGSIDQLQTNTWLDSRR